MEWAKAQLKELHLSFNQITDAGCATLATALDSGALPALVHLELAGIPASDAAIDAVYDAMDRMEDARASGAARS